LFLTNEIGGFRQQNKKEMRFLPNKHLLLNSVWVALFCLVSCKQEAPKAKVAINTFSMRVNGQEWTPFQDKNDPCSSTYSGSYATNLMRSGEIIPFYTIYAYRDPQGKADAYSENLLRMRVMNVTKPGTYLLDGTYKEDFDSYIIFQLPQGRYVNDPRRKPFIIRVDQITTRKGATIPGIKGSFEGILYNENNPLDSLFIEKGAFAFDIMGAGSKYHCGY
jgi:hypothetical protein